MAVTHLMALRTILADAVDAHVNTGSGTALVRLRDSTVTIVDFELSNPAFGNAVNGVITLNDTPIEDVPAAADGEVDNAQIVNRNGDVSLACSVTQTGMGGDIEMDNTNVAELQECTLVSLTYEAAP